MPKVMKLFARRDRNIRAINVLTNAHRDGGRRLVKLQKFVLAQSLDF